MKRLRELVLDGNYDMEYASIKRSELEIFHIDAISMHCLDDSYFKK